MTVLSTKTMYYIARKSVQSEEERISPIYYDPVSRIYNPMSNYEYATPYPTQEEVEKRVVILNMLAQLDILEDTEIEYITVKKTETIEEISSDI